MLSQHDQKRLDLHYKRLQHSASTVLGYPIRSGFDYSALSKYLTIPLNNIGDPFHKTTLRLDTKEFEKEVLFFFAELLNAPVDDWWGYVTSGGTEGNFYGLYLARELYKNGVIYISSDVHYSIHKILRILDVEFRRIRSQENGEIDYSELHDALVCHQDRPAIVLANIGTTMTEAKDDVGCIKAMLKELRISDSYIHCDAALCGAIAPFLIPRPSFDFADGADSISISGHKFIGSPLPCGLVLARKDNARKISRSISYIDGLDATITGSRSGLAPLFFWYAIRSLGKSGLQKCVDQCLHMAAYAEQELCKLGVQAWRNPNAITVVMPEVCEWLKEKWQLATEPGRSHLVLMPHVTRQHVDKFIVDLDTSLSSGYKAG